MGKTSILSAWIISGVIWIFLPLAVSQTYEIETALRANLSSGYDRFVRPNSPTNVTVFYNIRALQELDITEQQMTLTGWLTVFWYDGRFYWDNSNQIDEIEIDWGWRPEYIISNSISAGNRIGFKNENTRLRVYSSGQVKWNQMLHSTTSCDVDITNFPFDTQSCALEIVFWGHSAVEVVITDLYSQIQSGVYLDNAEWVLDGSTVQKSWVKLCCPNSDHPVLSYTLTFTRRRPFYVMNLVFPTILLSLGTVGAFLLPTESGERLGYSLTIMLSYTVQMSITAQLMPTTSKQVPLIASYLLTVLVLCALVTCNVVLHVKLFYLEGPVDDWLKVAYSKLYPIIFLQCFSRKGNKHSKNKVNVVDEGKDIDAMQKQDLSEKELTSNKEENIEEDKEVTWAKISILLDRICFYVYVIAVCTVNGSFLSKVA